MAFNPHFRISFEFILKAFISFGIFLVALALAFLFHNELTQRFNLPLEMVIAVIGCIILVFAYLASKIVSE